MAEKKNVLMCDPCINRKGLQGKVKGRHLKPALGKCSNCKTVRAVKKIGE